MADEKANVSLDEAEVDSDEALSKLLDAKHSPLRVLTVKGVYSGSVLTDVLIAWRVLGLILEIAGASAPEALALSCGVSPDNLLVTRLFAFFSTETPSPSAVAPIGALIGVFPSLTRLHLVPGLGRRLPSVHCHVLCAAIGACTRPRSAVFGRPPLQ
jgi:hypothetical protein